jgi:uncharacterized peroxidase-related enzyme
MSEVVHEFTREVVTWNPYVQPIDAAAATPAQIDALGLKPGMKPSPYLGVLAHDPQTLKARTPLFTSIMTGKGDGLARADREIGALVTSIVNGCVTCASIHARAAANFMGSPAVVDEILAKQLDAKVDAKTQAVIDFTVSLTATPPGPTPEQVEGLRAHGYTDLEILDLIHAVAIFNWANRLMHTLGEALRSGPSA